LAWTIDYTETAKTELRKLDKQIARRIVDFIDDRIAGQENPRNTGKALTGPLGSLWRYRVVCDTLVSKVFICPTWLIRQYSKQNLLKTLRHRH